MSPPTTYDAFARVRVGERSFVLRHGDLIGRIETATLVLDDPRISEAHAMVSLRRGELVLLSLRRSVSVGGAPQKSVALEAAMEVSLAEGLSLHIDEIVVPTSVLGVAANGLGERRLAPVSSFRIGPPLSMHARFDANAELLVWCTDGRWRARTADQEREVEAGDQIRLGAELLSFVAIPTHSTAGSTRGEPHHSPLHFISHYDVVEVHRDEEDVVTLAGVGARILSELGSFGCPVEWRIVATEIWGASDEPDEFRHRWDMALIRLRRKLVSLGIRPDLVRADGKGHVSLVLARGDRFEDRT